jgi:hypothetical protein
MDGESEWRFHQLMECAWTPKDTNEPGKLPRNVDFTFIQINQFSVSSQ